MTRGKRKDYKKLASPSNSDCEMDESLQQRQEEEALASARDKESGNISSPDEQELLCLAEELRIAEERLKKKEEFRRLCKKKEEVNFALEKIERKDKKKKINVVSLRGMDSVANEVDRIMDDKLNLGGKFSSSSSEENADEYATNSDSDEGSSDEDDEDRRKRSSKKKGKKKASSGKWQLQ